MSGTPGSVSAASSQTCKAHVRLLFFYCVGIFSTRPTEIGRALVDGSPRNIYAQATVKKDGWSLQVIYSEVHDCW